VMPEVVVALARSGELRAFVVSDVLLVPREAVEERERAGAAA
jgi:hypothetical protein